MKRSFKYFIFLIVIAGLCVGVLRVEPDKQFLFGNILQTCSGRSEFMYNALYTDLESSEVTFFGSSKTMNAINDSLVGGKRFLNLGFCKYGRNLDYFFIREYLEQHRPAKIVVEVRETEGSNSHVLTPFLMPVSEIAEGFCTADADIFSNLYNKYLCNLKYIRVGIFMKPVRPPMVTTYKYGFWQNLSKTGKSELNEKRRKDSIKSLKENPEIKKRHASEFYFRKIKALCDQKQVQLFFLYLPSYGNLNKKPALETIYSKYGTCIIPPDSLFKNPNSFADYNHLNKKAANTLSIWLDTLLKKN